ncbi:zinc finger protein 48-like isoform X4 [Pieris napi]|uniref:zinc finger protein 48-like isoform X4 n=1 Tax=Pieris napi TaxID=78633 RepID=UPI001FB96ABE|nr:zinc finger protein 48-like isoform X4 [Pieris napi]
MEVYLYNSTVCRLCGEENDNGTLLYTNEEYNQELSETINTYLPLKVSDDGQLPRTICPGCTIQVEATVEFFNLIIKGQKILRDLHEREVEYKKSITKEIPDTEVIAEKIVYEINTSDGIYHVEHPISLQMAGLDKPKRKRGRPSKKLKTPEELAREAAAAVAAKEEEARQQAQRAQEECHGKRRRKMPTRLKGAVQGRELEKIFIEEGVIDKAEGDPDAAAAEDGASTEPEVKTIGHVASSGEPVVVNVRKGRGRPKGAVRGAGQPSQCALCGLRFASVGRYMSHVASHNRDPLFDPEEKESRPSGPMPVEMKEDPEERRNERADVADVEEPRPPTDPAREDGEEEPSGADRKQFECNQCDKKFGSKQSKSMHIKAVHRGERPYRCPECGLSFAYPRSLALHALAHRRRRAAADTGYACDVCHKVCERESSSRARAGLASDLGPSRRPQVLSHPSSVTYHKQAAHGATQYVCGQCGKRFHHRQLLQRHQLVHSKRRPFDCEVTSRRTRANFAPALLKLVPLPDLCGDVQDEGQPAQPPAAALRGQEVLVRGLPPALLAPDQPHAAHALAHGVQALLLRDLRQEIQPEGQPVGARAHPHGREALRLPPLPPALHHLVPEAPARASARVSAPPARPLAPRAANDRDETATRRLFQERKSEEARRPAARPRAADGAGPGGPERRRVSGRRKGDVSQQARSRRRRHLRDVRGVRRVLLPRRPSPRGTSGDPRRSRVRGALGSSPRNVFAGGGGRGDGGGGGGELGGAGRPRVVRRVAGRPTGLARDTSDRGRRRGRPFPSAPAHARRLRARRHLARRRDSADPDARRPGDSGGGERVRRGRGGRGGERGGAGRARGRRGGTRSVLHHRVDGREARDGGRPRDNRFVDVIFNYKL